MFKSFIFSCTILFVLATDSTEFVVESVASLLTQTDDYNWITSAASLLPEVATEAPGTAGPTQSPFVNCSGIIFVQEASRYIQDSDKYVFFDLVRQVAASVSPLHSFGFFQYADVTYQHLQLTDYQTFLNAVNDAQNNYNETKQPDGSLVYLAR